jgi:predicted transposase/invertase (TIGR01784 family)
MISEEEKEDIAKFYRAEVRAEGLEQGKMEVARKMKEMGLTTEQISQATGLSPQAIAAL